LEDVGRRREGRQVAGRPRRQGQRRRHRQREVDARLDRLRRARLRAAERADHGGARERRRQIRLAVDRVDLGGGRGQGDRAVPVVGDPRRAKARRAARLRAAAEAGGDQGRGRAAHHHRRRQERDREQLMSPAAATTSRHAHTGDRAFAVGLTLLGGSVLFVVGVIVLVCARLSAPAFAKLGFFHFLAGTDWNPVEDSFGALPFVYGTLVTSAVAIVLAMPVAIGLALFLTEMSPARVRHVVSFFVEILAAIPSVVFGLWGLLVLVPILRDVVEPALGRWFGFVPLFSGAPLGIGFLPAGIVLAIMILPTIASVTIEVLRTMPAALREG